MSSLIYVKITLIAYSLKSTLVMVWLRMFTCLQIYINITCLQILVSRAWNCGKEIIAGLVDCQMINETANTPPRARIALFSFFARAQARRGPWCKCSKNYIPCQILNENTELRLAIMLGVFWFIHHHYSLLQPAALG